MSKMSQTSGVECQQMSGNTCYKAVYHGRKILSKTCPFFSFRLTMIEKLSREEKDKIYKDTLALLPSLGWPSWPPKEVPKVQRPYWWKQKTEILPTEFRLPFTRLIEVDGLSQAGKSTLRQKLTRILTPELKEVGWHLRVWEEHFLTTRDAVFGIGLSISPPLAGETVDEDLHVSIFEKDSWVTNFWLQIEKERILWERIENLIHSARPNSWELAVTYRGAIDATIWSYALVAHRQDPNFTIPDWYREDFENNWARILSESLISTSKIDAVVFMGISQEEAKKRRRAAKKKYPGWLTDSPLFSELSAWYGYFIESVYPNLHDFYGMGLLVLDGEASLEENLERLLNYCRKLVGIETKS